MGLYNIKRFQSFLQEEKIALAAEQLVKGSCLFIQGPCLFFGEKPGKSGKSGKSEKSEKPESPGGIQIRIRNKEQKIRNKESEDTTSMYLCVTYVVQLRRLNCVAYHIET